MTKTEASAAQQPSAVGSTATSEKDTLLLFDTTLRDGEQSPGASMTVEEKLQIAEVLDAMGVNIIEAGFAIASEGDFEAVRAVGAQTKNATVASLARASRADIIRAADALRDCRNPRIHTFIATSDLHMRVKLQMQPEAVLEAIHASVSHAASLVGDVEWSAEDATRSEPDFLCRAVETAIKAGARTINLPDTVGYATPEDYAAMFRMILERVPGADDIILSTHCHNDLGLAVANSLAGAVAGARQIECTVNGIGERAGNAAMEEIIMAVRTRGDYFPFKTQVDTTKIIPASRLVAAVTGFQVQNNKAIVGANAFAHESGIHQDGMLKDAGTYEIMTPESVGLKKSSLVMGKHSGRHALKARLEELGYEVSDNSFKDIFARFKALGDHKKQIYDEDIMALVDDMVASQSSRFQFVSLNTHSSSDGRAVSDLTMLLDGSERSAVVYGAGPVDAVFNAVRKLTGVQAHLQLFQVQAVTEGTDAQANCSVRLEDGGITVNGHGAHEDTVTAAAKAYISAVNRLLVKRERAHDHEVARKTVPRTA